MESSWFSLIPSSGPKQPATSWAEKKIPPAKRTKQPVGRQRRALAVMKVPSFPEKEGWEWAVSETLVLWKLHVHQKNIFVKVYCVVEYIHKYPHMIY